jgi:hypothetical protein
MQIGHRSIQDILEDLKLHSVEMKLAQYKQEQLSHVNRIEETQILTMTHCL